MNRLSIAPGLLICRLAAMLCLWSSPGIWVQAQQPSEPPLTRIQAVRALMPDAEARRVKLRGVVTFVSSKRNDFKINDAGGGIGVALRSGMTCPDEGDEVEVEGYTNRLSVQEHDYAHVVGEVVRIAGRGVFPEPVKTSVAAVARFEHYDQWVSVEGVVLMWTLKAPKLSLMITGPDTWAVVHVRGVDADQVPKNLNGARVRITGVNMGISHTAADAMMCPSPVQLEVLKPGTTDLFGAPIATIADVVAKKVPLADRVKMRGVVTAATDETVVYVRDGEDTLCAELLHGWLRSASPGIVYSDAGPLPKLKAGDEVELVGSVLEPRKDSRRNAFALHSSHVRVIGHQDRPPPVITTVNEVVSGSHTFDLVQIHGRLLHLEQVPMDHGEWRTSMIVEADGVSLPVTCQSVEQSSLEALRLNDELQLRGLVDKATTYSPRQLWLVSPRDAISLGVSPAVRGRQLWLWGWSAVLGIMLLGVWVTTLRRSLNRQRVADSSLRELNATLEKRVLERTTELEQSQGELERLLHHEKELGELKTRFVTMVSHEFRTPLGITMSAVELMRHYDDRLPLDQRKELCDDIYTSTRLMAGLMEQVLVLGRVEAGKQGCRALPMDLGGLAAKLTDESLSATHHKCPILLRTEGSLEGAMADESLLRHILGNLIVNAVKYSPAGSAVEFVASRDGGDAAFTIIDHGIGIPADDQAHLFEAFHRGANVGDIPGTGLGLVIVKRCVELHGGRIDVRSEANQGTTFTVRLPLFPPA